MFAILYKKLSLHYYYANYNTLGNSIVTFGPFVHALSYSAVAYCGVGGLRAVDDEGLRRSTGCS